MKKLLYYILPALMLITMIAAFPKASYADVRNKNCIIESISPGQHEDYVVVRYRGQCPYCGSLTSKCESVLNRVGGSTMQYFYCDGTPSNRHGHQCFVGTVQVSIPKYR